MKCPNCCSPMLITDETASPKSHVTFFRCSVCGGEHVSAQPAVDSVATEQRQAADRQPFPDRQPLMI